MNAFDQLFKKFSESILIVSYSSNSQPTQDEMVALLAKYKEHVEVVPIDYTYFSEIRMLRKRIGVKFRNIYLLHIKWRIFYAGTS